jgi:hypothetical protein
VSPESSAGYPSETIALLVECAPYGICCRSVGALYPHLGEVHNLLSSTKDLGRKGVRTLKALRRLAIAMGTLVAVLLAGAANVKIG